MAVTIDNRVMVQLLSGRSLELPEMLQEAEFRWVLSLALFR